MKRVSLLTVFTLLLFQGMTQDFQLKLWPDGAPNQNTPPGVERFYVDNGTARYDNISEAVITSYSIHYTKLYERLTRLNLA